MKFLLLLLSCSTCLAQFPYSGATWTSPSAGPIVMGNMVMWLKADTGLSNTSSGVFPTPGDSVKGWADQSGHGNFICNIGGTTPTYGTASGPGSGIGYISFSDGTSQSLTNAFIGPVPQPNTFFAICKLSTIANGAFLNPRTDQNTQIGATGAGVGIHLYNNGTTLSYAGYDATHWMVVCAIFDGASSIVYTNGVACGASGSVGTLACNGLTLGNYFNLSKAGGSTWSEFIWYGTNNLSASDRHAVERYLCTKAGITYSGP